MNIIAEIQDAILIFVLPIISLAFGVIAVEYFTVFCIDKILPPEEEEEN